jgi:hypothetical protein
LKNELLFFLLVVTNRHVIVQQVLRFALFS